MARDRRLLRADAADDEPILTGLAEEQQPLPVGAPDRGAGAAPLPGQLPRLAAGETVLFLAERSTSPEVQDRIVDLLARIGTN